jgi:hypothetical protein
LSQGPGDVPLLDYVINVGVALIGATVRFLREWRTNFTVWDRKTIFIEAMLNAVTAGFSGLLTFWVLQSWTVNPFYIAFAVGIMGHAGPEGMALLKETAFNAFRAKSNLPPPQK